MHHTRRRAPLRLGEAMPFRSWAGACSGGCHMPIGPSETVGKSRGRVEREEEVEGLTCLDGDGRGAERGG